MLSLRGLVWAYVPHRQLPVTGSGTTGCACGCGCIPAAGSRRPSRAVVALGTLRGLPRQPDGPAVRMPHRQRLLRRTALLLDCSAGPITGTACGFRSRSTSGDGPAPDRQDRLLARMILHYPGPVVSHDHHGRRVRADQRHSIPAAVASGCSTRSPSAAIPYSTFRWNPVEGCIDGRWRSAGPTDSPTRSHERTEDASFWSSKAGSYLRACSTPPPLPAATCGWSSPGRNAPGGAEDAEDILRQHGAPTGRWSSASCAASPEDRGDEQMVLSRATGVHDRPEACPVGPARRGAEFDLAAFLRQSGTLYMIAEGGHERQPPSRRCSRRWPCEIHHVAAQTRPGIARRPPRPAAAHGAGRDRPDLPRAAADLARRLRRQRHPAHPRRARRSAAAYSLAARRRSGRHGHLRGEGLAARHHRLETLKMASKLCGKTAYREKGQRAPHEHDVHDPRHDPQLPGRACLVIPRRPVTGPGRCRGLEGPAVQAARRERLGRLRPLPGPAARAAAGPRRTPMPGGCRCAPAAAGRRPPTVPGPSPDRTRRPTVGVDGTRAPDSGVTAVLHADAAACRAVRRAGQPRGRALPGCQRGAHRARHVGR